MHQNESKSCAECGATYTRRNKSGRLRALRWWKTSQFCSRGCASTAQWRAYRLDKARWLKKVEIDQATGCWNWTASRKASGYGQALFGHYRPEHAHRVFYQLFRGAIPEGLVVDHLCRNKSCVNPEHLEAVTNQENIQRAMPYVKRRRGAATPSAA